MKGIFNLALAGIGWLIYFGICCAGGIAGFIFFFAPVFGVWAYLAFFGAEVRQKKAFSRLDDSLMNDEGLIVKGTDARPFALFSRRKIVGITNSRVIVIERGLLGGFKMKDFQWKNLGDCQLSENVFSQFCGSNLTFATEYGSVEVHPSYKEASEIYKYSQSEEQAWEEKRRVRDMEEKRAQAGGITINSGQTSGTESQSLSISDEILKLKKMMDDGVLSDSEFQEMKSKLLSKGNNF